MRGCSCREGYTGADCRDRVCPVGFDPEEMWGDDVDTSVLLTHPCSNRGLCDAATGECACFPWYGSSDGVAGPGLMRDCGWKMRTAAGVK